MHLNQMEKILHGLLFVIRGALPINRLPKKPGLFPPVSLDALVPALLCATELLRGCIGSLSILLLAWEIAGESTSIAVEISSGLCEKLEMVMPGCCTGTGGGRLFGCGGGKPVGDVVSFCVNGSYGFWEKPGMLKSVLVTIVGGCRLSDCEDA